MPDGYELTRIAALAAVSVSTGRRVYLGQGNANNRHRVAAAARKLGLPAPPDPRSDDGADDTD